MAKAKLITLCSTGGAVIMELVRVFRNEIDFTLVTDRECGAEIKAQELKIPVHRITEASNSVFSSRLLDYTIKNQGTCLLAFYSRLLTAPLINKFPCFNVHPSMLPKYPGMGAEKKAYLNQDSEVGVTLHQIDEGIDTGNICYQYQHSVLKKDTLESYKRAAYIAKVKVSYIFCEELIQNGLVDLQSGKKLPAAFKSSKTEAAFKDFLGSLK